jgi:hypothetical protein
MFFDLVFVVPVSVPRPWFHFPRAAVGGISPFPSLSLRFSSPTRLGHLGFCVPSQIGTFPCARCSVLSRAPDFPS